MNLKIHRKKKINWRAVTYVVANLLMFFLMGVGIKQVYLDITEEVPNWCVMELKDRNFLVQCIEIYDTLEEAEASETRRD
jgi:hypothetical protein